MKKAKKLNQANRKLFYHITNIITIALVIECFLCSLLAVRVHARENCFERIEEITEEVEGDLVAAFDSNFSDLNNLAAILGESLHKADSNFDAHVEGFRKISSFASYKIVERDGTQHNYGEVPHITKAGNFEDELSTLPCVSEAYLSGNTADTGYIYQAVPVKYGDETLGILYGYLTIDSLQNYITITSYNGSCDFYIYDQKTRNFIFDTYHETLGSIDDFYDMETKYSVTESDYKAGILGGKSGNFVFYAHSAEDWFYTYYMPISINAEHAPSWSLQLTINEQTAFASFNNVEFTVVILAVCVVVLMFVHVFVLMIQNTHSDRADKRRLRKTKYINDIQRCLLNAHNSSSFIEQALKIVASEMNAETVLLFNVNNKIVRNVYFWPSKDSPTVNELVGRDIRDDFPMIFDSLYENKNFIFYPEDDSTEISEGAKEIFKALEVTNIMIVPIMDNAGILKGCICAANLAEKLTSCEALECVTYDFFMAITNIENLEIIKNMGTMDYLTGVKNRNSYESELSSYATYDAATLSCIFVDVNGLHEVNNEHGHKAGDMLLCSVAASIKKVFDGAHIYRLGGDEFVAFAANISEDQMIRKIKQVEAELAAKHYYVSCGHRSIEKNEYGLFDIDMLVVESEQKMYESKRKFYEERNIPYSRS